MQVSKLTPIAIHLQDTTRAVGASKKMKNNAKTALWVVMAVALGIAYSAAQMRQRDKVDAVSVKEGKIPVATLASRK